MKPKRAPATATLSERDLTILLCGPWPVGLTLHSPEVQHDRLRALWAAHEPAVWAEAARRGIKTPWYLDRELFVEGLRARR